MRAADLVRQIWGAPPPANSANSANTNRHSQDSQHSQPMPEGNQPARSQNSQHSQEVRHGNFCPPGATGASLPAAQTADAQAWQVAQDAIARARQHCAACDHWRSESSRPVCHKGHALCWRLLNPGKRTTPSRADAKPCPDKTPE